MKVDPDKYADYYGKPVSDEELARLAQAFGSTLEELKEVVGIMGGTDNCQNASVT